jgi:sigma-E factor negative regulatory protein RseC
MEAPALVREVDADRALLACEAPAAGCGACARGGGCALRRLAGGGPTLLAVPRRAPGGELLSIGTRVTVAVSEGELLRASVRAYLPPLAGLLAGPALARGLVDGDGWLLLGAVAGLVAGWAVARTWLRQMPPAVTVNLAGGDARDD